MRHITPTRLGIALAFPMLLAGGCITGSCGCEPVIIDARTIVSARVVDPEGLPILGAMVQMEVRRNPTCDGTTALAAVGPTDEEGEILRMMGWGPGDRCLQFWAMAPEGSGFAASDTQHVAAIWDEVALTGGPDSLDLELSLRAATIP